MVGSIFGKILCSYGDFLVTLACVRQNANVNVSLLRPFDIPALSTLYTNIVNFWRGDIFAILNIFYQNELMTDVSINKKLALTRYKHLLFLPMSFPLRCVLNNWCRIQQYTDWFSTFTSLTSVSSNALYCCYAVFMLPLFFTAPHFHLVGPSWLAASISHCLTAALNSFSVIHVSVNIKNNIEKDTSLLLVFLSQSPGGHAISFQIKPWVALRLLYLLIELFTLVYLWCGRTLGRSVGVRSRDYQIFSDGWFTTFSYP